MAEVINMRMARKRRDRVRKAEVAAANRAAHGATKAEKAERKAEADRTSRLLDGAKLERD